MSAYDLQKIIEKWERGKITTDQAIGQILLQLKELSERLGVVEKSVQQNQYGSKKD